MIDASYSEDKMAFSCYWCETCVEYMRRNRNDDDGYGKNEIYENDREEWESIEIEIKHKRLLENPELLEGME